MESYYKIEPIDGSDTIRRKIVNNQNDIIETIDNFCDIENYNIMVKIKYCYLSQDFITNNNILPVYCMSILYNRKILIGSLLEYYLMFETDEQKTRGKFYFILKGDDNIIDNNKLFNKEYIDNFTSFSDIIEKFKNLRFNKDFIGIINNGINIREKEREGKGIVFSYNINKNIINLNDVRNRGYI